MGGKGCCTAEGLLEPPRDMRSCFDNFLEEEYPTCLFSDEDMTALMPVANYTIYTISPVRETHPIFTELKGQGIIVLCSLN